MDRKPFALLLAPALLMGSLSPAAAQDILYETPGYNWPPARLEQAAWLSGTWRGVNDEGDEVLETWIGPKGAMMAGALIALTSEDPNNGVTNWAEHMAIVSNGYSLAFHYNTLDPQYSGGVYEERRLLRIEEDGCRLFFHGITIACEREEETGEVIGMSVYWKESPDEFNPEPELFTYRYTREVAE